VLQCVYLNEVLYRSRVGTTTTKMPVLQSDTVCCSVLHLCCSVLQCDAVCCSVMQCVALVLQCVALVMQRVALVLQFVTLVFQCVALVLQCVAVCCSVLLCVCLNTVARTSGQPQQRRPQ